MEVCELGVGAEMIEREVGYCGWGKDGLLKGWVFFNGVGARKIWVGHHGV